MIKVYKSGNEFLDENQSFLELNKYMTVLIIVDAKVLINTDKINYAIKVEEDNKKLLAIKVEPFNLLLYGDESLLNTLLNYLDSNNYFYDGMFIPEKIGDELLKLDRGYYLSIGMDFMYADTYTIKSSSEVIKPSITDLDEIYNNTLEFVKDCGLNDIIYKEKLAKSLDRFRVIKEDGKVISMASYSLDSDDSLRISHVYTKKEYRGKNYAKKVVNTLKNEILDMGYKATLNVDQRNPISYHIYSSLGFKKIYSQGIYLK